MVSIKTIGRYKPHLDILFSILALYDPSVVCYIAHLFTESNIGNKLNCLEFWNTFFVDIKIKFLSHGYRVSIAFAAG